MMKKPTVNKTSMSTKVALTKPASSNGFDEDDFDDIADTFESSYNFRYEEPYVS